MSDFRAVSPYIPRTLETKLNPHIYEMILFEYLKFNAQVTRYHCDNFEKPRCFVGIFATN